MQLGDADIESAYAIDYARNAAAKRDGTKAGSCTCTCETRPAASSHSSDQSGIQSPAREPYKIPPESASLIRTATRMDSRPPGTKFVSSQTQQQQPPVKSNVGQIVKVPPMPESMPVSSHQAADDSKQDVNAAGQGQQSSEQWDSLLNSGQESWGHGSRYPWKRLPDTMCYREPCQADKDCCLRFNLCDRSAHVCVDCWYGSTCTSERDCCLKYPYCQREWKKSPVDGQDYVAGGKCVNEMHP